MISIYGSLVVFSGDDADSILIHSPFDYIDELEKVGKNRELKSGAC